MPLQPEQAKFLLSVFIPQVKREYATTLKVLRAVPADKPDYQPDPRSMKALDLAWHLASADWFFVTGAANGEFPKSDGKRPENVTNATQVAEWYAENFPKALDSVTGLTGEQLLKQIPFHMFNETALSYLQLMLSHSIHHRGQLSTYLRPMGGKVPAIYGGSADEPAH